MDQCCEKFGIIIMQKNKIVQNRIGDFLEKEVLNMDLITVEYEDITVDYENKENPSEINCNKLFDETNKKVSFPLLPRERIGSKIIIRLTIKDEIDPVDIILFNEHNGYYPHNIYLYFCLNLNGYELIQTITTSL